MDFDDLEVEESRCGVEYENFSASLPEAVQERQKALEDARQKQKEALDAARQRSHARAVERAERRKKAEDREAEARAEAWRQELREQASKAAEQRQRVERLLTSVPETLGGAPENQTTSLSLKQAMALEDELIAEYSKPEFQVALHEAWFSAGDDLERKIRARQAVCLHLQVSVVTKYGFEASRRGVALSVNAYTPFLGHPEIAKRNRCLELLVNPDRQREAPQLQPEELHAVALDLAESGWTKVERLGVARGVLDQVQWEMMHAKAEMRPGQQNGVEISYRTDKRLFLDLRPGYGRTDLPGLARLVEVLVDFVGKVGHVLNGPSDGPRVDIEGHCSPMLARYGAGERYIPHIDNGSRDGRVLTLVYYLNRGWKESWGGCLRLYPGASRSAMLSGALHSMESVAVVPEEDTAVLFRADHLVHEVEATEKRDAERFALTIWFNGECFYGPFLPLEPLQS